MFSAAVLPIGLLLFYEASAGCPKGSTQEHPSLEITSEPGIGKLDVCDEKDHEEWFSRVGPSPLPDMADPVMKYKYCLCNDHRCDGSKCVCEGKTCSGHTFTKALLDKEMFRAFYDEKDEVDDFNHAAVGWSSKGTVCFYHRIKKNESIRRRLVSGCMGKRRCEVTCLGLQNPEMKQDVVLETTDSIPYWVVEVWFEKSSPESTNPSSENSPLDPTIETEPQESEVDIFSKALTSQAQWCSSSLHMIIFAFSFVMLHLLK